MIEEKYLSGNMVSFNYYLNNIASNVNYKYSISSGYSIVQQSLNKDGTPRMRQGSDDYCAIGNLVYFPHDTEFECSFHLMPTKISTKRADLKLYFENIDDNYSKQAFKIILEHLRLINVGIGFNRKKNPDYTDMDLFEIYPVYVFDSLKQIVYQKIILKFKKFKNFKELYVVIKNNDKSFNDAIKVIDNEFYIRYYSQLIEKKDTTEKLTKSEKQIVKMYYY